MHRERRSLDAVRDQAKEVFGVTAVALQLPIGREKAFRGIVDLLSGKAYEYDMDGVGKGREIAVPDEMADQVEEARTSLMESVAETTKR